MVHVEKLKQHLKHLKEKHLILENKITDAYNHYDADEVVKVLKIDKLKLKFEIEDCEHKILENMETK